jgi:YidC/Oxa1 family membrane protein insertase
MAESSKEFAAKSKEIKKKYKNQKEKQQEELMKLQAEYLPAQVSGCLPLIFQFVFFINLYRVISNIVKDNGAAFNDLAYSFVPKFESGYHFNLDFFGVNLGASASQFQFGSYQILPYVILVTLVGLTQFLSMKVMMNLRQKNESKKNNTKRNKSKNKKEKSGEDFSELLEQSTRQTMFLMPALFTFFAFNLPAGLNLYWTVQSTFVIIQQLVLHKFVLKPKQQEK